MVDPGAVLDPFSTPTTLVDGAVTVHVDCLGRAYLNLYQDQLQPDGSFAPILAARLAMSRDVMRDIADRMQSETMVSAYRSEKDFAELKRRMT